METIEWHFLEVPKTLEQMTTRPDGLTTEEVSARLGQHGRNEITRRKPVSPWRLFFKQFANYFILVLLFAALLAFAVSALPGEGRTASDRIFHPGHHRSERGLEFLRGIPTPRRNWRHWTGCWYSKPP